MWGSCGWEYDPGFCFSRCRHTCAPGKSPQQFKKPCLSPCPWESCMSWLREGPRRPAWQGDKKFHERCRFLSEVLLSSSVPHFWAPRCRDCAPMRIMEMSMMNTVACRKKTKPRTCTLSLSLSLFLYLIHVSASPSESVKYHVCAAAPKNQLLLFSCLVIYEPLPEPCLFARHVIL